MVMRHIGFCMKVLMVVVALALAVLAAGDVNANTGINQAATLSQWGMIVFTGLLLLSSIAFIRRRRG